jgi:protein-disulfide isomerase
LALIVTRRKFLTATAIFALAGAGATGAVLPSLTIPAKAATPSEADLLEPGPLPDMTLGDPKASVTVIEYASTTCPHCAHFYKSTYPEFKKLYIDTGKVYYIYREFVLNSVDAGAVMLLRCAPKDKYFALLDALFQRQDTWVVQQPLPPMLAIAKQAGFTEKQFNSCLDTEHNDAAKKLLQNIQDSNDRLSQKFGVDSTPTFFFNGKKHTGYMSIETMAKEIDPLLKS